MTLKPTSKIEIEGQDVSQYIVDNGFIDTNTTDRVATGNIFIDQNIPITINNFDQIKFYLNYTSDVLLFTGLITKITHEKEQFWYRVEIANASYRALKRTAVNKFRNDLGTGNARTIVTNLLTEYIPEFSYTTTTIPTTSFTFTEQLYANKYLNEIFDFISEILDREWWVDENVAFNMKTRDFPLVSEPIIKSNCIGALVVDKDISKMANYVTVDGARIPIDILDSGTLSVDTGAGGSVFNLTYTPEAIVEVIWANDRKTLAKEGADNYDNSANYDGYIKLGRKQIKFNDTTVAGSGTVKYQTFSIVHDELQDGASIDEHGITMEKVITDEDIVTQSDATSIAQNYLDNYSEPLQLLSANLRISSQSQITNWRIGNKVRVTYDDINDDYKIVGVTYNFGTSGIYLSVQFTDFPATSNDLFKQLVLKVKQKEESERTTSNQIVKYIFWGGNLYLEMENISIRKDIHFEQNVSRAFILDHPVAGILDSGTYVLDGTTGTTGIELVSINSDNGFTDKYEVDRWFEDTTTTTGRYSSSSGNRGYTLSSGSIYQSLYVEDNNTTYSFARARITSSGSAQMIVELNNTGTTGFMECGTVGSFTTMTVSGKKWRYKISYQGGGTTLLQGVNIQWQS